jgi:hypothetical protein
MAAPQPNIGNWYKIASGDTFEVVAVDDDDGTIEIQYFDGTVEELDFEDWESQWEDGAIEAAEPPEDWTGSVDVEQEAEEGMRSDANSGPEDLRAGSSFDRFQ